ncbi:MAG: ATP-binding protein [Gammaproteobacteria bacterium]|nr:ATP-binding protein [Gammaproteobacteria bacterium]
MIERHLYKTISQRLAEFPAVALLGPRQVGKTTLARHIVPQGKEEKRSIHYLDLENPRDRARLATDPFEYLKRQQHDLVILDEIQHLPEVFQLLRVLIDADLPETRRNGRFLVLGSASIDLLKQSSESLAGRISHLELRPFDLLEVGAEYPQEQLWNRGGYPESFLARSDPKSVVWRSELIRTYLERDIPQLGPRIPAETLRRLLTMLAHSQGGMLNAAQLARSLAIDGKTVVRYLDLMVDLLLVRRLPPYHINIGKRLVKSPKVYLRDSGLVHALLGLRCVDDVLSHPVAGHSWEGWVIENLLARAGHFVIPYFYRTAAGAEIDLVLEMPGGSLWAIEIKRGPVAQLEKGFHHAREDLRPERSCVVYPGSERYPVGDGIEAIGVVDLMREIAGR